MVYTYLIFQYHCFKDTPKIYIVSMANHNCLTARQKMIYTDIKTERDRNRDIETQIDGEPELERVKNKYKDR